MDKNVYIIERHEYREEGNDQRVLAVHQTLEGALEHFREFVWNEKAEYMYEETGSTDISNETMEMAGVEEQYHEDPEGTQDWHIWKPAGWNELFIHIFKYTLYK